jgi:hypothetical protein
MLQTTCDELLDMFSATFVDWPYSECRYQRGICNFEMLNSNILYLRTNQILDELTEGGCVIAAGAVARVGTGAGAFGAGGAGVSNDFTADGE